MDLAVEAPKSAEEIFPLEVWSMILDNLDDLSDLKRCYQACKGLAELLKPKRTTFLMPINVLPVLFKYVGYEYDYPKPYLSPQEALKMRLVSKSWKESLNIFYQQHPTINMIGCLESPNNMPFPLNQYEFDGDTNGLEKVERLFAKDFPLTSNPFIASYIKCYDNVRITDLEVPPERDFPASFMSLLEAFGSQIWNCNLHFRWVTVNRSGIYTVVRRYLSLMPNLRSLTVQIDDHQCFDDWECGMDALLLNQPFPKLVQLKELEMNGVPYPLSVGLLSQNTHVTTLSINPYYVGVLPDNVVSIEIDNLERLLVSACSKRDLVQLEKATWPIKVLELGMNVSCDGKLRDIFQTVSNFSNTLEELLIRYSYHPKEDNKKLQELRLRLQNLKKFKLKTPFILKTIDFLAECKDLQEIDFYIGVSKKVDDSDATRPDFSDKKVVADASEDEEAGEEVDDIENEKAVDKADSSENEKIDDVNDAGGDEVDEDSDDSSEDQEDGDVVDTFGHEDASASVIQFHNYKTEMQRSNIWDVLPVLGFITLKTTTASSDTTRLILDSDDVPESVHRFTWYQNAKYIKKLNAAQVESSSSSNTTSK